MIGALKVADINESAIVACWPFGTGGTQEAGCGVTEMGTTRTLTDRNFASAVIAEEQVVLLEELHCAFFVAGGDDCHRKASMQRCEHFFNARYQDEMF